MADGDLQVYRANLTAAEIPMISDLQGRSVITANIDQNFSRQLVSPRNKDKDIGLPQVYYGHNIVPTDAGFVSVGYQEVGYPPGDGESTFGDCYVIQDGNGNVGLFSHCSDGHNYVMTGATLTWVRTTDKSPTGTNTVSVANVNGVSYICFGGLGIFTYSFGGNSLNQQTALGVTQANILGVTSSSGYLILWTLNTIAWSSTVNPLDFQPSLLTGAGGGTPQGIKGNIVACLTHSFGFIIYTQRNAVGATYTGSAQYPFSYLEIIGAGGISNPNMVAYDANSTDHYAYTTAGIQSISIQSAQILFPWVTDFLSGRIFEDFNESTLSFLNQTLTTDMLIKVTTVADRYLVMSYGVNTFTHALVYDVALERWGKFKITHVDCFEYLYLSQAVIDTPKRSIGFCTATGQIFVATMGYDTIASDGVMLLGKYEHERSQMITLLDVQMENVRPGNNFNIQLLTSIDGKNNIPAKITKVPQAGSLERWQCRSTGRNHSLLVTGSFHASSLQLGFIDSGLVR